MESLPKIGNMIRCVSPTFEAGRVTFSGHTKIDLPRRTDDGKIVPNAFDLYQLKQVKGEWIYELVQTCERCEHCSQPIGDEPCAIVYLIRPDGTGLDARCLHTECVAAFKAINRADIDSIEDVD